MNKLKSRKFWMAILAVVLPVINEQFNLGLDNSTVIAAIGGLVAFIIGEAHVDAKRKEITKNEEHQDTYESNK